MKIRSLNVIAIIGFILISCTNPSDQLSMNEAEIVVFTSIVPQQYFVDRIGGGYVKSIAMVEPGDSPATYEPKPSQMAQLAEADFYFSIGVPFEDAWLEKIADTNLDMQVVDTTIGIEKRVMDVSHEHEDDAHQEGELDPHVWLSPSLVKIQAEIIYTSLVEFAPEHEEEFSQNLADFIADIEVLEEEMNALLADVQKTSFMVFHPSWGYFADDFGLEMIAIEVGGTEPSAAEMAELIEEAEHEDIRVVFAQPEFSTEDASTIAEAIGGEVMLISPLAYDWLDNMQTIANSFAEVLH